MGRVRRSAAWSRRLGGAGALLTVVLACGGGPAEPVLSQPVSAEARQEAAPWMAAEQLPDVDCERGALYAWLAVDGSPAIVAQALDALAQCPAAPDRTLLAAHRLAHADPGVAGAALRLARTLLPERELSVDDPVVSGVVASLQHRDKAVRYEAVEVLDTVPWTTAPDLEAAMLEAAADASPPVVSEVMRRARARSAGLQRGAVWAMTARYALLAHMDPGIRGSGAMLLAQIEPEGETQRLLLREALGDDHAHVRAMAAQALAEAGDLSALHLFAVALDEDEEGVQQETVWAMLPWTGTDGSERSQVHEGSYFERVDDAMLRAAVRLTEDMDDPYVMREINLRYLDLDLVGCVRDFLAWYETHADGLPPLDLARPAPVEEL